MSDLKNWIIFGLGILVVTFGLSTCQYKRMYKATDFALTTQNKAIDAQNKEASETIKRLTKERDAKQEELDKQAAAQEKTDEDAKKQITAGGTADRAAPTRVRYVSVPTRCGRDSAAGSAPSNAPPGSGDADPSTGILAPEAQQLFAGDKDAVETLQAAFNSCKRRLEEQR